jgi:hypothetical protein
VKFESTDLSYAGDEFFGLIATYCIAVLGFAAAKTETVEDGSGIIQSTADLSIEACSATERGRKSAGVIPKLLRWRLEVDRVGRRINQHIVISATAAISWNTWTTPEPSPKLSLSA